MSHLETAVRLLMDLVAIPSVNPCFSDGTGEKEIAEFIVTYAQKSGLETNRMSVDGERENVLIGIEGQSEEVVLWETHMDTVTAEGMSIPPFEPQIRDGKIFGRGACDAKASLAAMLQSLVEVAKKKSTTENHMACSGRGRGERVQRCPKVSVKWFQSQLRHRGRTNRT